MGLVSIRPALGVGFHQARNFIPTSAITQFGNSSQLETMAFNKAVKAPTSKSSTSWSETTKSIVYAIFMAMQIGQEGIEFSQRLGQNNPFNTGVQKERFSEIPVSYHSGDQLVTSAASRSAPWSLSIAKVALSAGLSVLPGARASKQDDDYFYEVMPIPDNIMDAKTDVVDIKAIFTGRVQGVGFRATTKEWADRLKITGTVRNLPDGTVEAYIRGPKKKIDFLFETLQKHMFPGHVTHLETTEATFPQSPRKFRVLK